LDKRQPHKKKSLVFGLFPVRSVLRSVCVTWNMMTTCEDFTGKNTFSVFRIFYSKFDFTFVSHALYCYCGSETRKRLQIFVSFPYVSTKYNKSYIELKPTKRRFRIR
jgi:hypothetical protein